MTYANILTVTTGATDDASALTLTAELASAHGAVARVLPSYPEAPAMAWTDAFGATYFATEAWERIYEARRQMRYKALEQAKAAAADARISFGDDPVAPRLAMAQDCPTLWLGLRRELALTDLVVAGFSATQGDGPWIGVLDEAMIEGRLPLVVSRGSGPVIGRPAAVAWDGSVQAGRAVRAAAPLLMKASSILVIQDISHLDEDERDHADPGLLSEYLERRGVREVSVRRVLGEGRKELKRLAASDEFGLLVAGAYGHARLREAIFGGATRTLLSSPAGPHLLLAN